MAGFDTSIFSDWAKTFLDETKDLRVNNQYNVLFMDSYAAHARYQRMNYLKENNIIVIGMPCQTSHILQSLDVSVFSSFKSFVGKAFLKLTRTKNIVDALDVANILAISFQSSRTISSIRSGFHNSGMWKFDEWALSSETLQQVLQLHGNSE